MFDGNPILQRYRNRLFYTGGWLLIALFQGCVVSFSNEIPVELAFADALVFSVLFACFVLPLWYPIRYSNWTSSSVYRNLVAYLFLAGMLVAGWMVAGVQCMRAITSDAAYLTFLDASTGWRVMEGLLFYAVAIMGIHLWRLFEEMGTVQKEIEKEVKTLTRVAVKENQSIHIISLHDIVYLEAYGDYVQLHTVQKVFLKEHTMKFFEEHLPNSFVRIHRSFIVNVDQVVKIELYEKESYRVWLKNGATIKASSNGYKRLKEVVRL